MYNKIISELLRNRIIKIFSKVVLDILAISAALTFAYLLRYDGVIPQFYFAQMINMLPVITFVTIAVGIIIGTYRQFWHYVSLFEVASLMGISSVVIVILTSLRVTGLVMIPYSIILIYSVLSVFFLVGLRALRRVQFRWHQESQDKEKRHDTVRTLFVGAGDTGNDLLVDIRSKKYKKWKVVGLLDDDPSKQGGKLHGFKILGPTTVLEQMIEQHGVQLVVVSMPSASSEVIKDIYRRSVRKNIQVKIVPSLQEQFENFGYKKEIKKVTLNDIKDAQEIKNSVLSFIPLSKKKESVLITGGAGYIGSHLVRRFINCGYRVTVLDTLLYEDSGIREIINHHDLNIINGDIANIRDITSAVKDVNTVIALAAIVGDPACGLDAEETLNLNYESTKILLEACEFYDVERLIFASSCSIYGASDDIMLTEESPINPVSLYARTRVYSEEHILQNSKNVAPVILRLSTIFGLSPRMRYDLVVNKLVAHGLLRGQIRIFGGEQWRPFLHCKDAAEAFYLATISDLTKVNNQIFNVGNNNLNYKISKIGDVVSEEVRDVKILHEKLGNDPRNYRVSFDKIANTLSYVPQYDLSLGIREMIEGIRATPYLQDIENPVFSNEAYLRFRSNN
ncbi:MAG: NAD-dependent epimerase/dehydratase family protein [Deltaproteobacteria bacterium]|nr:NAD-dependent epimerase/dehydratase family protein [Deltaproteobacteria bacterium]